MGLLKTQGYSLIILDDEPTALSGNIPAFLSSKSIVFLATCLMIVLIAAIVIGAAYAIRLHQLQTRLDELMEYSRFDLGEYNPRSIKSLRNQVTILENDIAESSLGGMIPSTY